MPTFQFKIQLKHITNPPVWRRVLVTDSLTFEDFHYIIQAAFGWENCHMYLFSAKGYGSMPRITLSEYVEDDELYSPEIKLSDIFTHSRQTYMYIYDFGDDWIHDIKLEKTLKQPILHPTCTGGEGACPPEDCGGPWGYANLLEAIHDPAHPEHHELREWMEIPDGKTLDRDYFDIDDVNEYFRTWEQV